jgi:AcrR family transcriptional regulator
MPRRRFHELPPERRDQLLETAGKEFAQHGYDGASLNHILAAAGVSKGAAYYYFDDKADLFATVGRHAVEHVLGHVAIDFTTLDAVTFWPKVRELYVTLAEHTREQPWLIGIMKAMWSLSSDARGNAILAPLWDWARGWLRALVERGQAVGVVREDLPVELLVEVMLALDGAFDRYLLAHLDELGESGQEQHLEGLLDMARRGLAPPGGAP